MMTKTMLSEKWLLLIYFDYFKISEKIEQESIIFTAQKMKFSIKDFFSKCDQILRTAHLVKFTEEILDGKLHFLSSNFPFPKD